MWSLRFLLLASVAGALCAQQGYNPADVQAGKQLYSVNCSHCHGPNGDYVSGVDLGHGTFRRASTDNEVVAIMVQGINGTPMPPANLSDQQAHQIVAYLRSLAAEPSAPAASKASLAHGKSLFESKGCLNCHRVGDHGSRVAPDLTSIGARRKRGRHRALHRRSERRDSRGKSLRAAWSLATAPPSREEFSTRTPSRCSSSTPRKSWCRCRKRI